MSDIHITRELLRAIANGELPARLLTEIGWQHLMKLCPCCREEMTAFQRERTEPASYDIAFRVLPVVLEKQAANLKTKTEAARKDLGTLLLLVHEERLRRVHRANNRFRGVTLARMLLDEAKRHMPVEPQTVHDLAETAEAVLLRTPHSPGLYDLFARAIAYRANSKRAQGDLLTAGDALRNARGLMRNQGVTDPLIYAEVDWIEGALLKDQRQLKEAEDLLVRAVNFYGLMGTKEMSAQPLITLGLLHYACADYQKAVEITKAAAEMMDPKHDPRSWLCSRHNLTLFLAESGDFRGAAEALRENAKLYRRFPDLWTSLRQTWLKGKIALGLGILEASREWYAVSRKRPAKSLRCRISSSSRGISSSSRLIPRGERDAKSRSGGSKTGEWLAKSSSRLSMRRSRRFSSPSDGSKSRERGAKRSLDDAKPSPDGRGTGK